MFCRHGRTRSSTPCTVNSHLATAPATAIHSGRAASTPYRRLHGVDDGVDVGKRNVHRKSVDVVAVGQTLQDRRLVFRETQAHTATHAEGERPHRRHPCPTPPTHNQQHAPSCDRHPGLGEGYRFASAPPSAPAEAARQRTAHCARASGTATATSASST